jgi:hypothetical protein
MGLAMYASYFVLFLQLFLSHYVFSKAAQRNGTKAKAEPLLMESCPPAAMAAAADGAAKARPVGRSTRKEH